MTRHAHLIETWTGAVVDPFDMNAYDINLGDIAVSLGNICRFNGHCRYYYSVAQHCVIVSEYLETTYPSNKCLLLAGLLHDAAEAYVGDMCRPIKRALRDKQFLTAEEALQRTIYARFIVGSTDPRNADWFGWDEIRRADDAVLRAEARKLMTSRGEWWIDADKGAVADVDIDPLPPETAASAWLRRFNDLCPDGVIQFRR